MNIHRLLVTSYLMFYQALHVFSVGFSSHFRTSIFPELKVFTLLQIKNVKDLSANRTENIR